MRSGERGFTLIELLVVMAIIATLMTLVAPRFFEQHDRAKIVVLEHNRNAIRSAIDGYRRDRFASPVSLNELVREGYLREVPLDPVSNRRDTWSLVTDSHGQIIDITSPNLPNNEQRFNGRY